MNTGPDPVRGSSGIAAVAPNVLAMVGTFAPRLASAGFDLHPDGVNDRGTTTYKLIERKTGRVLKDALAPSGVINEVRKLEVSQSVDQVATTVPWKRWKTAQARCALRGLVAELAEQDASIVVTGFGWSRTFPNVAAVEGWLNREQMGAGL